MIVVKPPAGSLSIATQLPRAIMTRWVPDYVIYSPFTQVVQDVVTEHARGPPYRVPSFDDPSGYQSSAPMAVARGAL